MSSTEQRSKAIKQQPLSHAIADELRKQIWSGEVKFGDRLLEADLSAEMEISRSSLREALQILEYEGLVVDRARKGTFVTEFTSEDMREINEIRLLLEVPALVNAVKYLDEEQINELDDMVELMKEKIDEGDWYSLFDLDMAFHLYLVNSCGNSRIIKIYNIIQVQIRTFLSKLGDYYADNKEQFLEEHKDLLKAIRTKDLEVVDKTATEHIKFASGNILNM